MKLWKFVVPARAGCSISIPPCISQEERQHRNEAGSSSASDPASALCWAGSFAGSKFCIACCRADDAHKPDKKRQAENHQNQRARLLHTRSIGGNGGNGHSRFAQPTFALYL